MKTLYLICFAFIACTVQNAKAQVAQPLSKIETRHKNLPLEKLYLTFDKPYYSAGDTLWFKSILLNGDFTAARLTDKIHVELFNDSLKYIEGKVIALNNGLGYGDFALTSKLKEGTYIIRAYTNWQQNFGNDYFFQRSFYIGKASEKTWMLSSFQEVKTNAENSSLSLKLRITNSKNEAVGFKDLEIALMDGKKRVTKADLQTKVDGTIITQIPLSNYKINPSTNIVIIDKADKTRKLILPVALQTESTLDLQFMPEGGHLVNGIFSKVAFKAIGSDGLGKDIQGRIINSKNEEVAQFSSTHKGMGSFYMMPTAGEKYAASYVLNGQQKKQQLPDSKEEGTTIRIDHLSQKDSLYVYIKATETKRVIGYQLIGLASGELIMSVNLNLKNGFATLKLPKQDFPDGIIHFTLFSPEATATNERQVFINQKRKIGIKIATDKSTFNPRDSVSLDIETTNEDGSPLRGTFAVSITDDQQVKQKDDLGNITSYFLLQSDVKGDVENAAWYFKDELPATAIALDQLLLTQGWIGYNWNQILPKEVKADFKPEKGNTIEGKLTGLFNKPMPDVSLTLLALGNNIFVTGTVSNREGKFKFDELPLLDSVAYTIKIKNAKGKTSGATIFVDQFQGAKDIITFDRLKPWYVNTDSISLNYFKTAERRIRDIQKREMIRTGTLLNEVVITDQARLKNFIIKTAWDAGIFKEVSKEDLQAKPQQTLLDLLKQQIPGFGISTFWTNTCSGRISRYNFPNFVVGGSLISHVMIDKINTHIASSGIDDQYNASVAGVSNTALSGDVYATNSYIFNTLTAADILDITIYKGCAYYFLEITTRSGRGPFTTPNKGVFVYRPLPIYKAKEFYSPKYIANSGSTVPDYRSTIFWDANIVTDENGKAKVSFYAADSATIYTVKVEGTDLYGRFGYRTSAIKVNNKSSTK